MTYVVTKPCLGTKDRSCIEVCPVDCFYDIRKPELNEQFGVPAAEDSEEKVGMLMIHPDECINCGACETECPVEAIFEDSGVPDSDKVFTELAEKELVEASQEDLDKTRCVP